MALPKWAKVLGVIVGIGLLLLLIAAVAGYFLWQSYGGEIKAGFKAKAEALAKEGEAAEKAGNIFGEKNHQAGCLDESLRRSKEDSGFMAEVVNKIFLKGCLDTAKSSEDFCEGVPSETDIIDGAAWAIASCSERGREGDQSCHRLVREVQKFCTEGVGP